MLLSLVVFERASESSPIGWALSFSGIAWHRPSSGPWRIRLCITCANRYFTNEHVHLLVCFDPNGGTWGVDGLLYGEWIFIHNTFVFLFVCMFKDKGINTCHVLGLSPLMILMMTPKTAHRPHISIWLFWAFRRMCIFMRARCLAQLWKCYLGPPGASWTGIPFWRGWLHARQCATAPQGGWRNLGKPSGSSKRSMTMSAVGRSCCRASTMMRCCKSASCLSTLRRHSKATTGASTSAFAVTTPS